MHECSVKIIDRSPLKRSSMIVHTWLINNISLVPCSEKEKTQLLNDRTQKHVDQKQEQKPGEKLHVPLLNTSEHEPPRGQVALNGS